MAEIETSYIAVNEVVEYLKIKDDFFNSQQEVTRRKEAAAAATHLGIIVTEEELQEAADIFRASRQLFTADDTEQWMKRIGITAEVFESHIETSLLVEKFKDHLEQEMDTLSFQTDHIISERLRELKFQKWFDDSKK